MSYSQMLYLSLHVLVFIETTNNNWWLEQLGREKAPAFSSFKNIY